MYKEKYLVFWLLFLLSLRLRKIDFLKDLIQKIQNKRKNER